MNNNVSTLQGEAERDTATTKCCCSNSTTCRPVNPLPTKIRPHVPSSKGIYIVLLWITLIHCLFNYTVFNIGGLLKLAQTAPYVIFIVGGIQFLTLLSYPLVGIIGEVYFTRYNILRVGTGIMLLPVVFSPIILTLQLLLPYTRDFERQVGGILIAGALIPFQIGLAMFEANIIQFGTDQLLFASSDQLSNFVHWSFWCTYLIPAITVTMMCPFNAVFTTSSHTINSILVGPLVQTVGLVAVMVVILLPCTKRQLHIEKGGKRNPLRLIYGVLKYATNNKHPVARSAFTYNDEESTGRIDFAKQRFGGPYTTEEVEDVKTFWRIIMLFLSLFGFLLLDNTAVFNEQYTAITLATNPDASESVAQCVVQNFGPTFITIVIGIPIYKLLLQPYFYRYTPNMTKRMGLGLFFVCISLAVETTISYLLNDAFNELGFVDICGHNLTDFENNVTFTFPNDGVISQNILIVPQVLNGFSLLLVFLTTQEFILAQAPRSMQGLLIGYWYLFQSLNVVNSTVFSTTSAGCSYFSYAVRLGLALISLLLFIFTSFWYKGRIRQELSLIKLKTIIENYTVRNLTRSQDSCSEGDEHSLYSVYTVISESNDYYKKCLNYNTSST